MLFVDVKCPRCGQTCGNGGAGIEVTCSCGWTGKLNSEDEKVLAEFFRRHQEKNNET